MKVYLETLGCRLNEAEIASWGRQLQAAGHSVDRSPDRADVIVLNTCAVTAEAARKSKKRIGRLHRAQPTANLVVTGCFAELSPEEAARVVGVDRVIGNRDKDTLVAQLEEVADAGAMPARATEPEAQPLFAIPQREVRTRAFIKVQDGCRNKCSFCIVTTLRGKERSRRVADLVTEVQELVDAGTREVVLTGVHLGGYGADLGSDLSQLVRSILRHTDVERLRLSSLEPWDLPEDFAQLWDDPRLLPHLHLPLQSGCDATLRRMSRRCFVSGYESLVRNLRALIPDVSITTDLIVGFPGETEVEWRETVETVSRIGFSHMHIFSFSPREGTRAAALPDRVPTEVARRRSREMHALAARMKEETLRRYIGTEREVLWEGAGRGEGATRRYAGYTDNYLRVETEVDAGIHLENQVTPAKMHGQRQGVLIGDTLLPDRGHAPRV